MPELTVLSLGWGVQSWTLAAMSALGELPKLDYAIHADTTWERQDTYEFAATWTPWLEERGIKVVTVMDQEQAKKATTSKTEHPFLTRSDLHVSDSWGGLTIPAMADRMRGDGQLRRQCTDRWKITPQRRWMTAELKRLGIKRRNGSIEKWLGISMDEYQRMKPSSVKYEVHRFPLIELRMTRHDCVLWLAEHNLPVPPKSACVFCPFHNRKTWQDMKRAGGQDWETAVAVDAAIRNTRPPYPLYVHTARRPLPEAVQLPEDYGHEQANLLDRVEDDDLVGCDSGHCFL